MNPAASLLPRACGSKSKSSGKEGVKDLQCGTTAWRLAAEAPLFGAGVRYHTEELLREGRNTMGGRKGGKGGDARGAGGEEWG